MDLQTRGAKKYPHSALLKSSVGLGWSTIAAELRSHGVSSTPVIVPQHTEAILAIAGNDNGLVSRTGAGQILPGSIAPILEFLSAENAIGTWL